MVVLVHGMVMVGPIETIFIAVGKCRKLLELVDRDRVCMLP